MSYAYTLLLATSQGPGAFGEGPTFEEAHARVWSEWRASFGTRAPARAMVEKAPPGEHNGELLKRLVSAPPVLDTVDGYETLCEPGNEAEEAAGALDEVRDALRDVTRLMAEREHTRARAELRWLVLFCADLDAALAALETTDYGRPTKGAL